MPVVTSHGTNIYYEVHGEGEPTLVFAHGMGGNAAIWFQQVAEFSRSHRVIVFDHRYFARSACPLDQFRPEWFADDALAILDAEHIASAIFVCQSMGGWTGSTLAVHHPDRVKGLVMSHTPGIFEHASAVNDRTKVAEMVSRPFSTFGSAALAHDFPDKNRALAVLYAQISSFNGIDPAEIPRAIARADIGTDTDSLRDYEVPTLFITADHDILFQPGYIEALSKTVPGAGFINLGDAGHSSYFELPAPFNAALQDFISSCSS